MNDLPAFLDSGRPNLPDVVVPQGVTPFFLPDRPVRGRLIKLGPLAEALLSRHAHNPHAVTRLAGKALALTAALATSLKYSGTFSLQAKGDGPVDLLLTDCTDEGTLRGYARGDNDKLAMLDDPDTATDAELLGQGYLAFTVDQGPETERHQGIVAIEGPDLSNMALHYFTTSEQFQCSIHLACAQTEQGWRASALILERIASGGDGNLAMSDAEQDESWHTAVTLASTISDAELLDDALTPERLLYRLFHTEGVAVDRARALGYGCRCSRAKLTGILEQFTPDELDEMAQGDDITMTCEFCNMDFRFPRADLRGQSDARLQ
ncbi:Hsp33 family molecular chaperone HslO [Acidisoma cellulosilytica]|uniref:Hsp33 family molecular chaperone HslO n=1 Tax=Acidisoma cellulosilyticum TaxID=2802395 RepID=A0A963Z436_9PROT|nr:Hsp33 family molecular chaperone HslO [Acidisoma cellulosilyticum]MCB8882520.1 Hsp33 family molecular chaperone HslO [Acidisoma cellulosilyticum]